MGYLAAFLAVGLIGGVVYVSILRKKIGPDLKEIQERHQDLTGPFRINAAVADYFRRDDPKEKGTKIVLRALRLLWLAFCLVILACMIIAIVNRDAINEAINK